MSRRAGPPRPPRCQSATAKGKRCKRTALEGTDPPKCVSHVGAAGRKTDLGDALTDRLAQLLQAGNYIEVAVAAVGVGRRTFYDWLERGDPDGTAPADQPFRAFRERIEHARAEGEARNVALVAKAASNDWKAAAWMLERQHPERWARQSARAPGDGASKPVGNPFDELDAAPLGADELAQRRKVRSGE